MALATKRGLVCPAGVPDSPPSSDQNKHTSAKIGSMQACYSRRPPSHKRTDVKTALVGAAARRPRRTWAIMSATSSALARAQRPR